MTDTKDKRSGEPADEDRDPLEEAGESLADAARAVEKRTDSQDADVVSGLRSLAIRLTTCS